MRILVGVDGSRASRVACDLVVGRDWPAATTFRLLAATEPHTDWTGLAPVPMDAAETERSMLSEVLDERADAVRARSYGVETVLDQGRPAELLEGHAGEWGADLIVVGNRGLGAAASAVLGSVSAHLVDHAPCPVLVARSPSASRMLVAADDTPSARNIPRILAAWGTAFRGLTVEVLSVANPDERATPVGLMAEDVEDLELHRQIAEDVVADLERFGWTAAPEVRVGDPGRAIVDTGRDWGADLIVTGSRGLGTLRRFVLGSVAHDVLLHTRSSVLVMRGHVPERPRFAVRAASPAIP